MLKHFISLEWKSFFRSASLNTSLGIKILMVFGALYFMAVFLGLGIGIFYIIKEGGWGDPLEVVNKFMVYYLVADLNFRYMLQKMPVTNIKPLLYLPIKKDQVVAYSLGKTVVSFFNWSHAFFLLPFSIVLLIEGYSPMGVISWHLGIMALIFCNNFINVLINNKDQIFYTLLVIIIILGITQYYQLFNITDYTAPFFNALYRLPWIALVPWVLLILLSGVAFRYFRNNMYLDAGLAGKASVAKTEDYVWLNRFGNLGTFLKNDIKLIKRNKRSKTSVIMSFFFIFYGLLFFTDGIDVYDNLVGKIFAAIFVSVEFLFSFRQIVRSWDSSYYPHIIS